MKSIQLKRSPLSLARPSVAILFCLFAQATSAATLYVDLNSPNPVPPYMGWQSAATNIQDAVDAAMAGDEVVVNDGVYAIGGRAVDGMTTNRVVVDKAVAVRSVNGPQFTLIQGRSVAGRRVRCVYLASGASLSGFTLTNGFAPFRYENPPYPETSGGGVWCESTNALVSNCIIWGNLAYSVGGGASGGTLNNCTLTGNDADFGGGAYGCTLNNCTLTNNSVGSVGGGASDCTLSNCTLTNNWSQDFGGGASDCTLNNCTLTGNRAGHDVGGGALGCTLNNCTLTGNVASGGGGGAWDCTLNNCTLTGNGGPYGGGALWCTLNNCTLSGNSASEGGGAYDCTLNNCTVTGNSANEGGGAFGGTLNNCTLAGNYAGSVGGGAVNCTLNNCTLTGNRGQDFCGGAAGCTLNNCTLTGNWGGDLGGGASGCTLNNCALTGNHANYGGGGAYFSTLNNCSLTTNMALDAGGGALDCTLNNCTLTGNRGDRGGGADGCTLNNCTLTGNSAGQGGGTYDSTMNNCIVYFNTAPNGANYYQDQYGGVLNYCCTTPMPTNGVGNITLDPLFVDLAEGNLRLQAISPCINAGNNAYVTNSTDLDGNPRIVGGTVDIGAYEFQYGSPVILAVQRLLSMVNSSGIAHPNPLTATLDAALASLSRGNTVAAANQLHAFQNKVQAQVAPQDPALAETLTRAAQQVIDALATKLHSLKHQDGKVQLSFSGTEGLVYTVQASTNLVDWEVIGVGLNQGNGSFEFEDANATKFSQRFYRVVSP